MMSKKNYWLYIEPHVFLSKNEKELLAYDTLAHKFYKHEIHKDLNPILDELLNLSNLYSVSLNETEIKSQSIKLLVSFLKTHFIGDCIPNSLLKLKPAILPPKVNIQFNIDYLVTNKEMSIESNITNYLNEITFYINGYCEKNCQHCHEYFKQVECCYKFDEELDLFKIKTSIIQSLKHNIARINIIGGNIYDYTYFNSLIEFLKSIPTKIMFYNNYLNSASEIDNKLISQENFFVTYLITPPFDKVLISNIIKFCGLKSKVWLSFIITNEEDYNEVLLISNQLTLTNFSILPFFNKYNYSFFNDFVFIDEENIYEYKISKEEIFINQVINSNNFGKLIILQNEIAHSNINSPQLGTINDGLNQLVLKELINKTSWFLVRKNILPCKFCIYNSYCSPLSNYEVVLNKYNLCKIIP